MQNADRNTVLYAALEATQQAWMETLEAPLLKFTKVKNLVDTLRRLIGLESGTTTQQPCNRGGKQQSCQRAIILDALQPICTKNVVHHTELTQSYHTQCIQAAYMQMAG